MVDAPRPRTLRIGIDGRELLGQPTGVGRFLAGVLRAWRQSDNGSHELSVFLPAPGPAWLDTLGTQVATVVDPSSLPGTLWEQVRLPRLVKAAGADVLLSPGYTAPLRLACPSVVVVHDVSFFAHPEWFRWREGVRRRWLTKASARRAAVVLTVSEFSAREIERWMGVPAERIHIVRHGSPTVHEPDASRAPVVLFVGSLFNRRRVPDLVAAFARVLPRVPDARLVLVGDNRTSPPQDPRAIAEGLGVGAQVEWRAYVSDEELDKLYAAARVFVFLSEYEGFAMTPLEAIAHGAPPLLLDTPVAREVYGAAARYVPPDVESIARDLTDLLTDETARAQLTAEGRRLLERYSWTRAAHDVRLALEQAASRA